MIMTNTARGLTSVVTITTAIGKVANNLAGQTAKVANILADRP